MDCIDTSSIKFEKAAMNIFRRGESESEEQVISKSKDVIDE